MKKGTSKYTKEEFQTALIGAKNQADVIRNLGLKINNGNYQTVRFLSQTYDLPLPVNDPKVSIKNATKKNRYSNEEYFVAGVQRSGPSTRKRLVNLGHEDKCVSCGQGNIWNGIALTLQIDHIDGDKFNNAIDNLRIICPNCHTQTSTYSNSKTRSTPNYNYCECGKRIRKFSARCNACDGKSRIGTTIIDWPSVEEIIKLIEDTNFTKAAKVIGCSDNGIRKYLTSQGVDWKQLRS